MASQKRFQLRPFTSLFMAFCGTVLALTGIACYIKPPTRIAEWIDWRLLLLDRGTWEALHTVFAVLFVIAGTTHITLNYRALLAYVRKSVEAGQARRRELTLAVTLALAFILLTIVDAFPSRSIMLLSDRLSESWGSDGRMPPIARVEVYPLATFCRLLELDLYETMERLKEEGFEGVDAVTTLRDIARTNGVPPIEIGRLLETQTVP